MNYLDIHGLSFLGDHCIFSILEEWVYEPHQHCTLTGSKVAPVFNSGPGKPKFPIRDPWSQKTCNYACMYVDQPSFETVTVCATCDCPSGDQVAENPPRHAPQVPDPRGHY